MNTRYRSGPPHRAAGPFFLFFNLLLTPLIPTERACARRQLAERWGRSTDIAMYYICEAVLI